MEKLILALLENICLDNSLHPRAELVGPICGKD